MRHPESGHQRRPLRVAMIADGFPLVSETFIVRQITALMRAGCEVDIYANRLPTDGTPIHPEVVRYDLLARTTYIDIPPESGYWEMPVWPITDKTWPPGSATAIPNAVRVLRAVPTLLRCLVAAPRLTRDVLDPDVYGYQARSLSALYRLGALCARSRRYDVIHAHFGPVANTFRFARALWKAPLIVSFHGFDFCTHPRQHGLGIYRQLFTTADVVTVNSDYTWARVAALGCPKRILRLLPVGLDPAEFPYRPRRLAPGETVRVVAVGRLVEIKGHEYAIRAIARVRERVPNVHLEIIGEGPRRAALETLARELSVSDIVTLSGARPSDYVRRAFDAAHLFVMPSVSIHGDAEGQGLALQEAQACGLPVVATEHGALPEGMAPGESGVLVPERDPAAIAARLIELIEHAECWTAMGREGRRLVEQRFDIHRLSERLQYIYAEAIVRMSGHGDLGQPVASRHTKQGFTDD